MICWLTRWRISQSLDSGRKLPVSAERHLDRCGRCRAFLAASDRITQQLIRDAGELSGISELLPPKSPALSQDGATAVSGSPVYRRALLAAVAVLVLAVLAGTVGRHILTRRPSEDPSLGTALPNEFTVAAIADLSRDVGWNGLLSKVDPQTQLQAELANLRHDAAGAVEHLMACLDR